MNIDKCPECGSELESGFVNTAIEGILWFKDKKTQWGWRFKGFENLTKEWSKKTRENIPALRCQECKFVAFQYK